MTDFKLKFDGNELLKDLKRLDQVKSMKDVINITHTQYPGTHCPLMGALLVTRGIKDSMAFVVGTDECVYYSKNMTMAFEGFGGLLGRCASVRLDTNDVTFGSVEKVEEAFDELVEEQQPSCVFLISTCVIEIIGDDFDALAEKLTKKHGIPVLPIHTEHFKCEDHIPGIERAITACAGFMEKQDKDDKLVNVLGQRQGDFTKSEVAEILKEHDIKINLQLPKTCTVSDIKAATKSKLNIVVNDTALGLAKVMLEKFGIPYVNFKKSASYETNYLAYKDLFEKLEIPMPKKLEEKRNELAKEFAANKDKYKGLTYIYGGAPFASFEHIRIMTEFGLEPLLLQVSAISEDNFKDIDEIVKKFNPYVTRSANVAGMMHIYDALKPDLNFGPAFMNVLKEKHIVPVRFDKDAGDKFGFELSEMFLSSLQNIKEDVQKAREEKVEAEKEKN